MDFSDIVQTPTQEPTDQPPTAQKKPYWQVLDEYHRATSQSPELSGMPLPEFSSRMNQIKGTNEYDEGLNDSPLRRAGVGIARGLHHFGGVEPGEAWPASWPSLSQTLGGPREGWDVPELARKGGEAGAAALGAGPELAKAVGKGTEALPETAVTVGAGIPLGGLPTIAGLSALETYGETGRALPAAISGTVAAVIPKAMRMAGQAALKAFGAKTVGELSPGLMSLLPKGTEAADAAAKELGSQLYPSGLVQRVGYYGAQEAGMLGATQAGQVAQTLTQPDMTWEDKLKQVGSEFSPSSLVSSAVGQLPFTVMGLFSPRTNPMQGLRAEVEAHFADRFTKAYTEDTGGKPPTTDEVEHAMETVQTGRKPTAIESRILPSIGQAPIQFDIKTPIMTSEGEWNPVEAIESVRSKTNDMLTAQGESTQLSSAHDQQVLSALKLVSAEGGRADKATLTHLAANRVVDLWRGDTQDLSTFGESKQDVERRRQEAADEALETKIAATISPTNPDGSPNHDYDQNVHQRIALVSGDQEHWREAGITEPPSMAVKGDQTGQEQKLVSNIIDQVTGLPPKPEDKVARIQQQITSIDQQIDQLMLTDKWWNNPEFENLTGEKARLEELADAVGVRGGRTSGEYPSLTADTTAAARYGAFNYDKPFDINDPKSVRKFVDTIAARIRQAEDGWMRSRANEETVVKEPTDYNTAAAQADQLQKQTGDKITGESGVEYRPVETAKGSGQYQVKKFTYRRFYPLSTEAVEPEIPTTEAQYGEKLATGAEEEPGVPITTLDELGAKMLEQEAITRQFNEYGKIGDPAVREGRRAALARNVVDYVKTLPDSLIKRLMLEETGVSTIREPAVVKARLARFMEFLRDNGKVELRVTKGKGDWVNVEGVGNLAALNAYLDGAPTGPLGYGKYPTTHERAGQERADSLNAPKVAGLNLFEQFYVLSKHMQRELPDPRIFGPEAWETRPRGDFAWVPPGFKDNIEQRLTTQWPQDLKKAIKTIRGVYTDTPEVLDPKGFVVMRDPKTGQERRFGPEEGQWWNPLETLFVKGIKHDLVTSANNMVGMFDRFGQVDPQQLQLAKTLLDRLPYIRNMNVGFGIPKDPLTKGYIHSDDVSSSAGILLAPVEPDPTGKRLAQLMTPANVFPHFVEELGHASTMFAYHTDPVFKAEVDRTFEFLKNRHTNDVQAAGKGGVFVQSQMHALDNPLEMLAGVFKDGQFHQWLKSIPDTLEPLSRTERTGSMFDRLWQMLKGLFTKWVGPEGADTMLSRVAEHASRGVEIQTRMNLESRGNIYEELHARGKLSGDIIHRPPPQPVPKPQEAVPGYPWMTYKPTPLSIGEILKDRESALADAQKKLDALTRENVNLEVKQGLTPQYEADVAREEQAVAEIRKQIPVEPQGQILESRITDEDATKLVQEKFGRNWYAATLKDMNGVPFGYKVGYKRMGKPDRNGNRRTLTTEKGRSYTSLEDALSQVGIQVPEGQVMESRIDPQPVLDSLKSASIYPVEDDKRIWFKPYDLDYFRNTFAPAFGNKMTLEQVGSQWGYSIPKTEFGNLTQADLNRMPLPRVKSWAPSAFETLKGLYRQQGSDDKTSEALAAYNLQFAALLKNSENAVWGKLPPIGDNYGLAWGYSKMAGLTPAALERPGGPEITVRHEGTHVAGMHPNIDWEAPDVQRSFKLVNDLFTSLTPPERQAFLDGLGKITDKDSFVLPVVAGQAPDEFAAQFMGHVGSVISNVPKPSAYLRDLMRFAPDEMANLLKLTTLRRAQGLDRLKSLVEQETVNRGLKNPLSDVIDKVSNVFNSMSRSALDIATDQAEFYRMRSLYPDMYKPLLKQLQTRLDEAPRVGEVPAPSLAGTILESRENDLTKYIRSYFTLPTSDGRLPTKLGFWDRQMTQFSQLALKYPILRPFDDMLNVASKGAQRQAQIKLATALAGAYEGTDKILDDQRTKQVAQFVNSPRLRGVFSKVALDINAYGDKMYDAALKEANGDKFSIDPQKVTGWLTPEWINGVLQKYGASPEDRKTLNTLLEGSRNQIKLLSSMIVGSHLHSMETMLGKAIALNTDLRPEVARSVAQTLSKAMQTLDTDPSTATQSLIPVRQAIKDDKVYSRLLQVAEESWHDVRDLERFLSLRMPYYMSERRPGKYGLFWKGDDGKITSRYFANGKDRDNYVAKNDINPVRQTNPSDQNFGVSSSVFDQLDAAHKRMVDRLTGLFGEEQAKGLGAAIDLSTDLKQALNSRDILKLSSPRKLAPGREELDMFDAHQHYQQAVLSAIKSRFMRTEKELLFTAPEFDNEPNLKQYVENHVKAVLQPDSQVGTFAQKLGFMYYLFANPSSMIMQLSHQVMGLAPMLTRMGQSVSGSYATIAQANKLRLESLQRGSYKDPQIQDLVERHRREGGISSWVTREIDHNSDLGIVNRIRATSGQGLWTPFDLLKNKTYQGYLMLRRLYDVIPTYNSEVAFVAAALHLRGNKGGNLTGDNLYNESAALQRNSMYPGGKENRPGFFQNLPRSAAQMLWSLQTYANGLTTELGELIRRSANPKGAGLSPAQAKQTRKAAAQMLMAQTAVAGVLGMPFAELALQALQKLFPEHNVEKSVRDVLAGLGGDDEAMGSSISSALVNGIPSALSYAPDLGSRFALHGVFHTSPYGDVTWQELMGPTGGILNRVFEGAQAGLRGEPMKAVQSLMPNGFRRIWKALEQGNTYTTESGQMVADNLRPEEIVARAIGFTPARVARIYEFERLSKLSEQAEKAQQSSWTSDQVRLLKAGRDPEVQQNIAQRVAETKGVYPATRLANDVSREYERSTTPTDLRKFGSRSTVLAQKALRGVLGTQASGPSNVERLQVQQQIAARLGLGGPTHRSFHHAAGIDQLLQLYPNLTVPQANLLLTHAVGSRPSPDLYQELLSAGE